MDISFDSITLLFLLWVVVLHPVLAWRSYRTLVEARIVASKLVRFRYALYAAAIMPLMSLPVIAMNHLHWKFNVSILNSVYGLALGGLLLIAGMRFPLTASDKERIRLLYAPTNYPELFWAIAAGLFAACGEEVTYRAVLFELLRRLTGNSLVSVSLCLLAFGHKVDASCLDRNNGWLFPPCIPSIRGPICVRGSPCYL